MRNLCLITLLPALTCAFFLPIPPLFQNNLPVYSHGDADMNSFDIDLKEICPVILFAETELCNNTSLRTNTIPPQLCTLLSLLNHTFCQDETTEKGENGEKHVNKNTKFNISNLSNTTEKYMKKTEEKLYKELDEHVKIYIINFTYKYSNSNNNNYYNKINFDPKDLCPIFDLVDKTFCTSASNNNKLDPKELCPLLEFVDKELCS